MYTYVCVYIYIYIYIYIHTYIHTFVSLSLYIYIYRERERRQRTLRPIRYTKFQSDRRLTLDTNPLHIFFSQRLECFSWCLPLCIQSQWTRAANNICWPSKARVEGATLSNCLAVSHNCEVPVGTTRGAPTPRSYVYIYICICICICMYIYIYRERERERYTHIHTYVLYIYIYIYIYTYIYIDIDIYPQKSDLTNSPTSDCCEQARSCVVSELSHLYYIHIHIYIYIHYIYIYIHTSCYTYTIYIYILYIYIYIYIYCYSSNVAVIIVVMIIARSVLCVERVANLLLTIPIVTFCQMYN